MCVGVLAHDGIGAPEDSAHADVDGDSLNWTILPPTTAFAYMMPAYAKERPTQAIQALHFVRGHASANGCFFRCRVGKSVKAISTWPETSVEGWRLNATNDELK